MKPRTKVKKIVDAMLPPSADERTRLNALVHENVLCQIHNLQTHPVAAAKLATGQLKLYGWVYNIENGTVDTYDAATGEFVRLTEGSDAHATPPRRIGYVVPQE